MRDDYDDDGHDHVNPGVTITRDQLEAWAGRELTDEEVDRLDDCIPHSSIPDAIGTIVGSFDEEDDD